MSSDKSSFAALFEGETRAEQRGARRFRNGDRVEVTVVAVGRDAVFVDLGGKQEGLFERRDLEVDGKLLVAVGARLTATVRRVESATGQVHLSPVAVQGETAAPLPVAAPTAGAPVVAGQKITGKVSGIERFGIFVQIDGQRGGQSRGLVPIAELGIPRGADLKKHFTVGQAVEAKVASVEDGRVRLSIKELATDAERAEFDKHDKKRKEASSSRSLGTLGDLLAKAKKK